MVFRCARLQDLAITERHIARRGLVPVSRACRTPRTCATLWKRRDADMGVGRTRSRPAAGDWLSGRAPRSHRGGHWFDPSIAHPAQRPVPILELAVFDLGAAAKCSSEV